MPGSTFGDAVRALCDGYLAAYAAQDAQACAAGFTADARVDHPFGPPATGRAEIAALHTDWFGEAERDKRMELLEAEASGAWGSGLLHWSAELDGPRRGGVTLAVLRRTPEGWRFHRMALVPDP